jgi:nitroimidazol reductase NimA-like FMN-containing flavoprotein (pyridoxamine 5'-phosphate oxidase superfamily)
VRPELERLDKDECLRLLSTAEVGRIAYESRFGLVVLPVNYKLYEETIVFRTAEHSALDEDLSTGIANAEYEVAFEVDESDRVSREGWSVLIRGAVHHVESEAERDSLLQAGVEPWAGGEREHFLRIVPTHITGRRVRRSGAARLPRKPPPASSAFTGPGSCWPGGPSGAAPDTGGLTWLLPAGTSTRRTWPVSSARRRAARRASGWRESSETSKPSPGWPSKPRARGQVKRPDPGLGQ